MPQMMDFVVDSFADGRQFRLLNVLDDSNREGLGIEVASHRGRARRSCPQPMVGRCSPRPFYDPPLHRMAWPTAVDRGGERAGIRQLYPDDLGRKTKNCAEPYPAWEAPAQRIC